MSKNSVVVEQGKIEEAFAVAFAPVVALSELIKNASDSCFKAKDVITVKINTVEKSIRIKDNGYGFSSSDILNLRIISRSDKMSEGNELTRIGEYYAGSKGFGILTAFNLCELLEIKTFSQEENKAYQILWEKGSGEIVHQEINEKITGTELILKDVSDDNISMIVDEDELEMLCASSITYYRDSDTLPTIEIFKDGHNITNAPSKKLELLYQKNKKNSGAKGYFVAKASFSFHNNQLKISYDENIKHLYDICDASIDLADPKSLREFLKRNKISIVKPKEIYEALAKYTPVELNSFSGEWYVWRGAKPDYLDYPCGVKIFANNYGLYNYLRKNNDWLQLSEISQNRKSTNYKLKNTYGYVHFDCYNENASGLKISNERNDFKVNLTQKKFMFLMQDLISNIFATIDIQAKNYKEGTVFESKVARKALYENTEFSFKELIKTNLTFPEIDCECDDPNVVIDEATGIIKVSSKGAYQITFTYEDQIVESDFVIKEIIPSFEVKKRPPAFRYGNTYDLKELIKVSSLQHLTIEEIQITSEDATIQKGDRLSTRNTPGKYTIDFYCEKYEQEVKKSSDINIETPHGNEANKIKNLFETVKKYQKINDIIHGVAENYVMNPTFSIIAIRPLIEITLKAFIAEFYSTEERKKFDGEVSFDPEGKMNNLFNKIFKDELPVDPGVLVKYKSEIASNRKDITKHYKKLDPNRFVHGRHSNVTKKQVFDAMNTFSLPINFIIEAINVKVASR